MPRMICLCIILFFMSDTFATTQNKGWWKNMVFYEIYPRSFMDSNDDGIGDLRGIISKMSYFVESGIGGIVLAPIYASPLNNFGYDISDFKDVHPDYGTIEDLRDLIQAAKENGIRVILDLIPNYTSDKHPWFKNSLKGITKYRDYYIWWNGRNNNTLPPNDWINYNDSAWTATTDQWYLHEFNYKQPILNYSNPNIIEEMENIIYYWMQKGIDGIRLHVSYLFTVSDMNNKMFNFETIRVYSDLNKFDMSKPYLYMLIQRWQDLMDEYASSINDDEKIIMTTAYSNGIVPRSSDYNVQIPLNLRFVDDVNMYTSTAKDFKRIIDDLMSQMSDNATPNWVMGTHDSSRLESRFPGKGDQMLMLQMILPGVAITYNGEEIGMLDKHMSCEDLMIRKLQICNIKRRFVTRLYNRTPFQWNSLENAGFSKANHTWVPVNENYKELNLKNQENAEKSYYKIYTALTKLRKKSVALRSGHFKTVLHNNNTVLAVIRQHALEAVALVMNFDKINGQIVDLSNDILFPLIMRSKIFSMNSVRTVKAILFTSKIFVPANTAFILVPVH